METEKEMLSRLNGMAKGDATWDLSENDMNAIGWALNTVEGKFTSHNSAMLKLPNVEEIISEVVGSRNSMHDIAVTAGINECYRIIVRQLQQ